MLLTARLGREGHNSGALLAGAWDGAVVACRAGTGQPCPQVSDVDPGFTHLASVLSFGY